MQVDILIYQFVNVENYFLSLNSWKWNLWPKSRQVFQISFMRIAKMLSRNIVLRNTFFWFMCYSKKFFFIFKQIVVQAILERYSMNSKWVFKRIAKFPPKEALPASLAQSCTCPSKRVLLKCASAFPLGGFARFGTAGPSFFAQLLFSNQHGSVCILQVQRVPESVHLPWRHPLLFTLQAP